MRPDLKRGWPYGSPPTTDFDINWRSPQADGLVFWLPLLGPRGGLLDRVQNQTLSLVASPVWTPDRRLGRALLFDDASSQYATIDYSPVTGPPITMSCWFNSNDIIAAQTLVGVGDSSVTVKYHYLQLAGPLAGDPLVFRSKDDAAVGQANTTTGFSANTWHHAFGVLETASSRFALIDAGSKGTNTDTASPSGLDRLRLSCRPADALHYMSGMIADVRIYNVAKTEEEAYQMYADPWDLYRPRVRLWPGVTFATVPVWVSPDNHATMGATPTLEFTSETFAGNAHFHMQLDKVNTFDGGDLRELKTNHDITGWQYWDGDSWEAFQAAGMPDAFSGNNVRHTIQSGLSTGTWYRRVRQG